MPSTDPESVSRRRRRSQPLTVIGEIHYVDGEGGRFLAQRQAEVLRDLLEQIATRRQHADAAEPAPIDGPTADKQSGQPG